MKDSIEIISENIRALRAHLGLSRKDFGELTSISPSTIANIESGKNFNIKSIKYLSHITDISLEELSRVGLTFSNDFKRNLIAKFDKDHSVSVILNRQKNLVNAIMNDLLGSTFLVKPREISEIRGFFMQIGYDYKGNSIHVSLKRFSHLIKIGPHPSKKGTFLYSLRNKSQS